MKAFFIKYLNREDTEKLQTEETKLQERIMNLKRPKIKVIKYDKDKTKEQMQISLIDIFRITECL